jgi:transposase
MKRIQISENTRVKIAFSRAELASIAKHAFIDRELEERLRDVTPERGKQVARLTLYEIEHLLESVIAEANHTTDAKLRSQFDALYRRLVTRLDAYDDGNWQHPA